MPLAGALNDWQSPAIEAFVQGFVTPRDTLELGIDELRPGRYQPRQHAREESLAELAASIREQGVLQPLIVRAVPTEDGAGVPAYEIVAGERRWRAARLAGLATVPVIVRELSDQSALAVALIENLQREDLNPIDQARSMSQLVAEFDLTHDEIAKALGRSRASVTNFLRLLDLADDVKNAIVEGTIDMGHARALLPLDAGQQTAMARKIERLGWSVRQVEKAVRATLAAPAGAAAGATVDLQTRWLQNQLARELGERIAIQPGPGGGYVLKIGFANLPNLEATLQRLQELLAQVRETAGPRARERS
ncbi:MAG TPA: ParB/RepB/Spo0J family partition protein [Gammaproteobacteria bacterium]|nr:ParB/RepB/Spo0J family partition protein [Gammaproteobacteria bacterium]